MLHSEEVSWLAAEDLLQSQPDEPPDPSILCISVGQPLVTAPGAGI